MDASGVNVARINNNVKCLRLSLIAGVVVTALTPACARAELYFAPGLISSDPNMVADLQRFEKEGAQLPGTYRVEVYVNDSLSVSRDIRFVDGSQAASSRGDKGEVRDNTGLMACLSADELEELGVNVSMFPDMRSESAGECISPGGYIKDAFTNFDFAKMRLDISVPQVAMRRVARGYISPERWDEGINAALLNYTLNSSDRRSAGEGSTTLYANLGGGINVGPWRLRDNWTMNNYSGPSGSVRQWQHISSTLSRTIIPMRGLFVAGDATTPGDVFDSLGFRGVQLSSDTDMYPDSIRGYAPVIKGVARTNARVDIRQNGYQVYQAFVPPGAFSIEDLYSVTSSGDLEVTVTEADGGVTRFTVPYSAVPILQRQGNVQYALSAGSYRASGDSYDHPQFAQGTMVMGLPYNTTAYGGMQYSGSYLSGLLGGGLNLGLFGAVSADITHARSELPDGSTHSGQSLRFLYARSLNATGTTFQLTGYRYSTQGFHTLDETALKQMSGRYYATDIRDADGNLVKQSSTNYYSLYNNRRSKFQAMITQSLGDMGSLYFSGVHQTYWNRHGASSSMTGGFSSSAGSVAYSLSYSYNRDVENKVADRTLFLNISVPLSAFLSPGSSASASSMYATYGASRDKDGAVAHSVGLSGSALEGSRLNWNLSQQYTKDAGNNGSVFTSYKGAYGAASAGYSYGRNTRQTSLGVAGGILLHRNGLTFGQQMGDTTVLVAVPGVNDTGIENESGVRTDWRGYAIKPWATAYRENRVAVDASSLRDDVELDDTVRTVVPTKGAIVRASFKGSKGARILVRLLAGNQPVPFGAIVSAGERSGIVGDDGQVYLSGMPPEGAIHASWGGEGRKCTARYRLPDEKNAPAVFRLTETCRQ